MGSLTESCFHDVLNLNKLKGIVKPSLELVIFSTEQWQCKLEFLGMSNAGVTKVLFITTAFSVTLYQIVLNQVRIFLHIILFCVHTITDCTNQIYVAVKTIIIAVHLVPESGSAFTDTEIHASYMMTNIPLP